MSVEVEISDEAMQLLRCFSESSNPAGFTVGDSVKQPDGWWTVIIEDDTFERLFAAALPGEDCDQTTIRLLRYALNQKSN